MTDSAEPARADEADEARLVDISQRLSLLLQQHIGPWVERSVLARAEQSHAVTDELRAAAQRASAQASMEVGATIRDLLATDIDEQRSTPLSVLRAAIGFPTAVLLEHEVPAPDRPAFEADAFPEDVFGLTPANFADIHPDLHAPGLEWGAAKAFVHLRRREAEGRV